MKFPLAIFTAAAAVVAALVRLTLGDDLSARTESNQASPVPRITAKLVEQLAYTGATDSEIADRFLVDETMVRREYADVLRVARALRKITIRGLQFDLARKLNATILGWLGRNELNQSNSPTKDGQAMPEVIED